MSRHPREHEKDVSSQTRLVITCPYDPPTVISSIITASHITAPRATKNDLMILMARTFHSVTRYPTVIQWPRCRTTILKLFSSPRAGLGRCPAYRQPWSLELALYTRYRALDETRHQTRIIGHMLYMPGRATAIDLMSISCFCLNRNG